ncbi:hypothetical protein PQE18_gp58 [Arthrobacter phage DrSierra]|uniref:Uncharacterized protein n=1 Tax=Arthrobacter phage DrSierra TaxID=2704034 RepID=A0A6G6XKI0_9CAUD|nr:hypothetical protein PQE18_gp58 [Arthrobacter phage DrSierra]QIG58536.1 hypothetical protein SEA_DRSIERRA_58 [Arthrobacter phage DrSierra]
MSRSSTRGNLLLCHHDNHYGRNPAMTAFPGMNLDTYLDILGQATPEDGPYNDPAHTAEELTALNTGFAALAAGMVAFVKAAEPIVGYEATRSMIEDVTHTFPVEKNPAPVDPFAELAAALAAAMGLSPEEAKEIFDVDDES